MADKKISELAAITGSATAADDYFILVDTSGAATKKISRAELNNAIEADVLSTVNIDGGTIDGTVIGATTPAAATVTTLAVSSAVAEAGTLTTSNVGNTLVRRDTGGNFGAGIITATRVDAPLNGTLGATTPAAATVTTLNASGNVGIGLTAPAVKLDVNGIAGWGGGTTGQTAQIVGTNSPLGNGGNLRVLSNTTQATNIGGSLVLGGYYTAQTNSIGFGEIGGRKENATAGNTAGYLAFGTRPNGGNMTERARITSSGNVGIGLTAPTAKLEIAGGIKFSGQLLAGTSGSVYSPKVYAAYVAGTSMLLMRNLSGYNRIDSYNDPISATYPLAINSSFCKFNIADAEKMRLTSTGLGIGTTAPVAPLAVVGGTSNASNLSTAYSLAAFNITPKSTSGYSLQFGSGPGDKPYIQMSAGGSSANTINLQPYGGYVGIGMTGDPAAMLQVDNSSVAILAKNTNTSNLSTPALQVSKGDNNSTTSNVLVQFFMNGVAAGQGHINANGGAQAAFGSFSDRRLKENIVDLPPQLANILTLRPVEFDYIESEGGSHQIGFIAQNVQEVYPDLVGEREDGMLTLSDLNKNDARLIKAIQEQQALIEALTTRITALEG